MHLLNSARLHMNWVPFVHEVSAAVAVEYFNEVSQGYQENSGSRRAYALVTAGPGLTNAVTGIAGAFLESRECLVLGGQVKSVDLSKGQVRQRGIQEVDGVSIASPVSKLSARVEQPLPLSDLRELVLSGHRARKGPVFLEFCLDAQGAEVEDLIPSNEVASEPSLPAPEVKQINQVAQMIEKSERPIILIGGGVDFTHAVRLREKLAHSGLPLMTTWNGIDRVDHSSPNYLGRPNTWGQRAANVLLAQADLVVALGTRLGIQQTGFNWKEWTQGKVVQVEIDPAALQKGHPHIDLAICADANQTLTLLLERLGPRDFSKWIQFGHKVLDTLPPSEKTNKNDERFISPFDLVCEISEFLNSTDVVIPASSGSGQFVPMEVMPLKFGQRMITNKGLAAMGYGLAAAIGAALANKSGRTILFEGDGSFSQNIQELGTVAVQNLNLKIFILDNDGYASIRTTQKNYFGGHYMGCDHATGLGFPDWHKLSEAFQIPSVTVTPGWQSNPDVVALLESDGPAVFVVPIDPEQTYFPKVTSRIQEDGSMMSNPVSRMTPELDPDIDLQVFRFFAGRDLPRA